MCNCDDGYICTYHEVRVPCSICGRENDGERPGPLCRGCRATAKAAGRSMAEAARYPDPEGR